MRAEMVMPESHLQLPQRTRRLSGITCVARVERKNTSQRYSRRTGFRIAARTRGSVRVPHILIISSTILTGMADTR